MVTVYARYWDADGYQDVSFGDPVMAYKHIWEIGVLDAIAQRDHGRPTQLRELIVRTSDGASRQETLEANIIHLRRWAAARKGGQQ